MSAAKKRTSSSSRLARLGGLPAWLVGTGRSVLVAFLLVGVSCGGVYWAWIKLKPRIVGSPEYEVGPWQVEITPARPAWIRSDIREEVFRDPILDGRLSLLDDDLIERVKKAFARHPWVAEVEFARKRHPASVLVSLVYRQPVCMVEVPAGFIAADSDGGLLPVDREGILLPSGENFTPVEAARYPRLLGVERPPGIPGQRWNDPLVIGAAEIAAAFGPAWQALRLYTIVRAPEDASAKGSVLQEPLFALCTKGTPPDRGSRIFWGHAPGANVAGEIPAAEKVALLQRYVDSHDSLDGPGGKPQGLDVRTIEQALPKR